MHTINVTVDVSIDTNFEKLLMESSKGQKLFAAPGSHRDAGLVTVFYIIENGARTPFAIADEWSATFGHEAFGTGALDERPKFPWITRESLAATKDDHARILATGWPI